MSECSHAALQVLDRIERREGTLLTWGFIDGILTEDEIAEMVETLPVDNDPSDVVQLTDELLNARLLMRIRQYEQVGYRSRFAEGVRLMASLRQILRGENWPVSPRLVADYRVMVRPRRYPKRELDCDTVMAKLAEHTSLSALEIAVGQMLLNPPSGELKLAQFQFNATAHLLSTLRTNVDGGLIVCAGTGTGKTMAFYLPCFMKVAANMNDERWTQVIAIYPRNELLKDQLTEAYRQARLLDIPLTNAGKRHLTLGAYFGPTPHTATSQNLEKYARWERSHAGYVCPFLRCPKCDGDLVWRHQDLAQQREVLHCQSSTCSTVITDVILTRRQMELTPPEILFTTTEMMNRQMSSTRTRKLYGIGQPASRSPYVMLLDETHSYTGVHGAHVALLIRRWRQRLRSRVQFVGLSATLTDAQGFFEELTGIRPGDVTAIGIGNDLEEDGNEYQLVLRGDPVSGTSLLSTTIQASMLMGRLLDPQDTETSGRVFGNRLFVFTDDLDVTNRLYHNLLDAEGMLPNFRAMTHKEPLARFRSRDFDPSSVGVRWRDGQHWRICEDIGHQLSGNDNRLRISRTSSQDTGVARGAQIIVATASLEVGYNDPWVGAVMQHKAPRDNASFLQRKGRAGRRRITRPWTTVVLSDYGRDRIAFQGYEQLFDPVLERPVLPIRNRYVLKIQAVFAFMDWLAQQLPAQMEGSVWDDFSRNITEQTYRRADAEARVRRQIEIIEQLLTDDGYRDSLAQYLRYALGLEPPGDDEIQGIFWEPPRGLMTAVLPTILRRLKTNWRLFSPQGASWYDRMESSPLPEFLPSNLFSALDVPDVTIALRQYADQEQGLWMEPLVKALNIFAPGRVTRRYGVETMRDSHWFPINPELAEQSIPVEQYCAGELQEVGQFQAFLPDKQGMLQPQLLRCVAPYRIEPTFVPKEIRPTSNSSMDWRSQFCPRTEGIRFAMPANTPFSSIIDQVHLFTHNQRQPVNVRRFTVGAQASVLFNDGREANCHITFTDDTTGEPVCLGFEHEVDGLAFVMHISPVLLDQVIAQRSFAACRSAYFLDSIIHDQQLQRIANHFRLGWLGQVYLSLLLKLAWQRQHSIETVVSSLEESFPAEDVEQVLQSIFQVVEIDEEQGEEATGRLHEHLRELLHTPNICARLAELSRSLWETPTDAMRQWLAIRLKATLGGALLQACYQVATQSRADDLLLDLESGATDPESLMLSEHDTVIWITENTHGGCGTIEEIARRFVDDPRRFFLLVEMALGESDYELIDESLACITSLTQTSAHVRNAFSQVRDATSLDETDAARTVLISALERENLLVTRGVLTSLNMRLLRSGTSEQTDLLLADLLAMWMRIEEALHVEVDARIFSYLASEDSDIAQRIREIATQITGGTGGHRLNDYTLIYGLLWPRGTLIRERALSSYNPYATLPAGDARLLRETLCQHMAIVSLTEYDWFVRVCHALNTTGIVRIVEPAQDLARLQQALLETLVTPVESDVLRLYPYVVTIQRLPIGLAATLHLREAIQ